MALIEGPKVSIERAEDSSGVLGMGPRFVSYKYCVFGKLRWKLAYRDLYGSTPVRSILNLQYLESKLLIFRIDI